MLNIDIPGRGQFHLEHLVLDVNGTLAVDGQLIDGVAQALAALQGLLRVHLVTADTHGHQTEIDRQINLQAVRLAKGNEAQQKASYVRKLGADSVVAIGQGANDAGMLAAAAIGVSLISVEGLAVETLQSADLLMPDILSALALFQNPMRMVASLRK
ncbi:MAG: HAD family hydrolase [Anaerolineaceae bacterium]|nr:HAD family hydrolase [Anaerolineaceae bacterium]